MCWLWSYKVVILSHLIKGSMATLMAVANTQVPGWLRYCYNHAIAITCTVSVHCVSHHDVFKKIKYIIIAS